jgi:hypothetical protein
MGDLLNRPGIGYIIYMYVCQIMCHKIYIYINIGYYIYINESDVLRAAH